MTNNLRTPNGVTDAVSAVQPAEHSTTAATVDGPDTPTIRADDLGSMLWGFRTELNNSLLVVADIRAAFGARSMTARSRLAVASIAIEGLTRLLRRILL